MGSVIMYCKCSGRDVLCIPVFFYFQTLYNHFFLYIFHQWSNFSADSGQVVAQ